MWHESARTAVKVAVLTALVVSIAAVLDQGVIRAGEQQVVATPFEASEGIALCEPDDAFASLVASLGPRHHLPFLEESGDPRDAVTGTAWATSIGVQPGQPGVVGCADSAALLSPGATAVAPVIGDWTTWTIALWFMAPEGAQGRLLGLSGEGPVHRDVVTGKNDREVWITPAGTLAGGTRPTSAADSMAIESTDRVDDGAWHLVVLGQDADGLRLSLDGRRVGWLAGATTASVVGPTDTWRLGHDAVRDYAGALLPYLPFTGLVDEVMLWDRMLTEAQVTALWRAVMQEGTEPAPR